MAADGPNYTAADWEVIAPDGTPGFGAFTSLAHGWASGATASLSGYVLGIRPVSAGYQTWIIQPHPGTLTWALGRAPTPYGPIDSKWSNNTKDHEFVLEIQVPTGTSGTVVIPSANGVTVRVNGNPLSSGERLNKIVGIDGARTEANYLYLKIVEGGTYRIETR
jgi:alpha-L-rhamnosidase